VVPVQSSGFFRKNGAAVGDSAYTGQHGASAGRALLASDLTHAKYRSDKPLARKERRSNRTKYEPAEITGFKSRKFQKTPVFSGS